jgi:hypothetical protein
MLGSLRNRRGAPAASSLLRLAAAAALVGVAACDTPLDPSIALVLSQYAVEFRAVRGSTTPVTRTIEISNAGGGRLGPVSCGAQPAAWLACAVSDGNVVTLTADPAGLAQNPAQATLELTAPGISSPAQVLIDFRIDQPVVTLSAGTVTFAANEGANTTTPAQRTLTVTNTGAGSLSNLTPLSCAPTPVNARVGCSVNQSNGVLTVQVDPSGLAPGTYVYPVAVSSPNTSAPATFAVALTVSALPRIALSTRSLHFQAVRGTGLTAGQNITVTNSGGGSLGTLSCVSPVTWLTCSVLGSTLTLTANASALTASPLPATVSVGAVGAVNTPQTLAVTFEIQQPQVAVSPLGVAFVAPQNSPIDPESHTVTVSNVGAGTFANLGNITCTPASGSPVLCERSGSQLEITLDPDELDAGVNTYSVTVAAQHSSVNAILAVTVDREAAPRVGVAQNTVHFAAIRGSTTQQTQTVGVVNLGGGQLGVVDCPDDPATWLMCSVNLNGVQLIADPTGLITSPSDVVVQVTAQSSTGVSQGTASITVSLTLEQPVLSVDPTYLQLAAGESGTVGAVNIGEGTEANLGTISCSPPANVTCSVNQSTDVITITAGQNLAAGTLHVVTVTAANANNPATVTIAITGGLGVPVP